MTVITKVGDEDMKFLRELRRHPKPVIRLAKQAMQQHQRFAVAKLFEMKLHRTVY